MKNFKEWQKIIKNKSLKYSLVGLFSYCSIRGLGFLVGFNLAMASGRSSQKKISQ